MPQSTRHHTATDEAQWAYVEQCHPILQQELEDKCGT